MSQEIDLIKYQALGNDYLVVDMPAPLDEMVPLLPLMCDRNRGLGSDGLLAFDPHAMTVRIFNPDASEAQKSGHGLRIIAAHAVLEHGAGDQFDLRTTEATNPVTILARRGAEVTSEIDIGAPTFRGDGLTSLHTPAGGVQAVLVSVGNPHCVVFDQPVTRERCLELGPFIERHEMFPERTNVQLTEALDRHHVRI